MSTRPTVLPGREGHPIRAPARAHEHDLARPGQVIDGEKHLVPRQIGALTRHLVEVAGTASEHDVNHLIFRGRLLCHAPPCWEESAPLQ